MKEDYSQGTNPPGENAIDFPCSYAWRSYYQETLYGEYLPSIELPKQKMPEGVVYRHYPHQHSYTKKQAGRLFIRMEETENKVTYLERKINEFIDQSGKHKKAGTY